MDEPILCVLICNTSVVPIELNRAEVSLVTCTLQRTNTPSPENHDARLSSHISEGQVIDSSSYVLLVLYRNIFGIFTIFFILYQVRKYII